jgi:hypothetical protein
LSHTQIATNFSNAVGLTPSEGNTSDFNLAEEKAGASNITSLANNTEFSLGNLLNNTSNNSVTTNTAARFVSFELTSPPLSSFTFPMESLARRSGFQGISYFDAGGLHKLPTENKTALLPDPQIAVSRSHVGEMVNVAGAFYTKDGELIRGEQTSIQQHSPFPLDGFFKTGKDWISDPRIMYDNSTKRWFALILDITNKSVILATSSADDPINSKWNLERFSFENRCPDQPSIAISKDKVVISVNIVDICAGEGVEKSYGVQFRVIDKSDLINNRKLPRTVLTKLPEFFSLIPAKLSNPNETSDIHLVQIVGAPLKDCDTCIANRISVVTLSGSVQDIKTTNSSILIQNITRPVVAEQPGRIADPRIPIIDTSDTRVLDASWHNGKLWLAADDRCPKQQSYSCFRLVQVDTSNYTLIQDFDVSAPGKYLFFPALATDVSGNLGIVFGVSSKDDYPSLFAVTRAVNAPVNNLSSFIPLALGLATSNAGTSSSGGGRYGDYFGVTIDPSSPNHFWAVGEFIPVAPLSTDDSGGGVFWSTFIANFASPAATERSLPAETTTAVKYALSVPTNPLRDTSPNHKNEEFLKSVR